MLHIVNVTVVHTVTITGTDPEEVVENEDIKIMCSATGGYPDGEVTVQWKKDGVDYGEPSEILDLTIEEVKRRDLGNYICKVQNFNHPSGWASSSPFYLDVKCK